MLSGLSGVVHGMDDVLVFGSSEQERNERLLHVKFCASCKNAA